MKSIKINKITNISDCNKAFVIAEIGSNHNQDLKLAKKMIDEAKKCGADAVKFQTFKAKFHFSKYSPSFNFLKNKPMYKLIKDLEIDRTWHKKLQKYCNKKKIIFFSSPCDYEAVDELESINVPIYKVASFDITDIELIKYIAKTKKPIMLKRHYGASLRDWLGAAEYILCEGNKKVILCERGVSTPHTHRSTSRFLLDLQVVPAAKEITHLPIAVDPSHATFWRPWVESMTLASIASGADAIMLEVHPDPENSAVDPLQPIDFKSFKNLVNKMDKLAKSIGRKVK